MARSLNIKSPEIKIRGDKIIWIIVLFLALISIIMVYSSSTVDAMKDNVSISSVLWKQIFFVIVGFASLFVFYMIPLRIYRMISIPAFGIILLTMILLPWIGKAENDATRWIPIFGFRFQPTEFAKIALVIYLARVFEVIKIESNHDYWHKMIPWIVVPVGALLLASLAANGSLFVMLCVITLIMLVVSEIKWKYLGYTALIGIAGLGLIYGIHVQTGFMERIDTVESRIEKFFTEGGEEEEELNVNEMTQLDQAIRAVQLGGILGQGPGNSSQRYKIQYVEKDFIYSVIVEEWGLVGGIIVVLLYLAFLNRCLFIARRCTRVYSSMAVLGLSSLIFLQAMIHIGVNVGILPVTGQTLPMISRGGTSLLTMCMAFGMILSINKTIEISIEKKIAAENEEKNNN